MAGIGYAGKNWKDSNITYGGECPSEFISNFFNTYLTSYFPHFLQVILIGQKLNAWKNRPSSMASTRLMQVVTIGSPSMIGTIFKNTLGTILMIHLVIGILLLSGNYI